MAKFIITKWQRFLFTILMFFVGSYNTTNTTAAAAACNSNTARRAAVCDTWCTTPTTHDEAHCGPGSDINRTSHRRDAMCYNTSSCAHDNTEERYCREDCPTGTVTISYACVQVSTNAWDLEIICTGAPTCPNCAQCHSLVSPYPACSCMALTEGDCCAGVHYNTTTHCCAGGAVTLRTLWGGWVSAGTGRQSRTRVCNTSEIQHRCTQGHFGNPVNSVCAACTTITPANVCTGDATTSRVGLENEEIPRTACFIPDGTTCTDAIGSYEVRPQCNAV